MATIERFAAVGEFLARAGDYLVAREAEHNLILGIAGNLRDHPPSSGPAPYFAVVSDLGRVVAAALQTPPYRLVISEIDDQSAIALLVEDVVDRDLPGVFGPTEVARRFVDEWVARGGRPGAAAYVRTDLSTVQRPTGTTRSRLPADRRTRGSRPRDRMDHGVHGRSLRRGRTGRGRGLDRALDRENATGSCTCGWTASPCPFAVSAVRRPTGSGSDRSTRHQPPDAAATRARWSRPSARPSSMRASGSASCSRISPTRLRTTSTRRSVMSPYAMSTPTCWRSTRRDEVAGRPSLTLPRLCGLPRETRTATSRCTDRASGTQPTPCRSRHGTTAAESPAYGWPSSDIALDPPAPGGPRHG